jgi:hypothetical protein
VEGMMMCSYVLRRLLLIMSIARSIKIFNLVDGIVDIVDFLRKLRRRTHMIWHTLLKQVSVISGIVFNVLNRRVVLTNS